MAGQRRVNETCQLEVHTSLDKKPVHMSVSATNMSDAFLANSQTVSIRLYTVVQQPPHTVNCSIG